jgi:hypothetical protein
MDGKIGHFWIVHSFPVNDAWIYMSFGQTWMHSGIKKTDQIVMQLSLK